MAKEEIEGFLFLFHNTNEVNQNMILTEFRMNRQPKFSTASFGGLLSNFADVITRICYLQMNKTLIPRRASPYGIIWCSICRIN